MKTVYPEKLNRERLASARRSYLNWPTKKNLDYIRIFLGASCGEVKRAWKRRNDRMKNNNYSTAVKKHYLWEEWSISSVPRYWFDDLRKKFNPRAQNWTYQATVGKSRYQRHDVGRYSSRCRYIKYEHALYVTSRFLLISPKQVWIQFRDQKGRLFAPRGWEFFFDYYGIAIRMEKKHDCNYHFSPADWISVDSDTKKLIKLITENARGLYRTRVESRKKTRQEEKINKEIKAIPLTAFFVRIKDALEAGNCGAGIRAWIERNQLNGRTYLRADQALRLDPGNGRLKLSVEKARERHYNSLKNGYSTI